MIMNTMHATWLLTEARPIALREAAGLVLKCLKGTLWITLEGDRRDIVLKPGESFVLEGKGVVLVGGSPRAEIDASYLARQPALARYWAAAKSGAMRVFSAMANPQMRRFETR